MEINEVIQELKIFREARNWNKYHSLINLARALNIESSEVEKVFQWKNSDNELSILDKKNLKFEIADVLIYAYYMCDQLELDPNKIVLEKLEINKNRHWNFEKGKNVEDK